MQQQITDKMFSAALFTYADACVKYPQSEGREELDAVYEKAISLI